jgi:uncharacterized protein (TIGR03643 family)
MSGIILLTMHQNLTNKMEEKTEESTEIQPELPAKTELDQADIDRIVEMAWEDRTSFDIIYQQFGVTEPEVIKIMRREMKRSSFRMWRERVSGRQTKHAKSSTARRFKCDRQDKPK